MSDTENVFDVIDYRGERVIFTKKKLEEKSVSHPELLNLTFLRNLKQTILDPDEVWPDYDKPRHNRCYYKRYSTNTYIKVIICITNNPCCRVVSAYETNYIKEIGYPKLTRLK